MTREQAKELLPIIQAFAEGKEIQSCLDGVTWFNCGTPTFSPPNRYRIKPEPLEAWINVFTFGQSIHFDLSDAEARANEERREKVLRRCVHLREVI
jgi:hypothetical protein